MPSCEFVGNLDLERKSSHKHNSKNKRNMFVDLTGGPGGVSHQSFQEKLAAFEEFEMPHSLPAGAAAVIPTSNQLHSKH